MLAQEVLAPETEIMSYEVGRGRLFLVGNGPSLIDTPMGLLIGEESWATSRINLLYRNTDWRPTRYFIGEHPNYTARVSDYIENSRIIQDVWVRDDLFDLLATGETSYRPPAVVPYYETGDLPLGFGNFTIYRPCREHLGSNIRLPDGQPAPDWPAGWHEPICQYGATFNLMLQLALQEGWNPVYLIGCDLGFGPGLNHFDRGYELFPRTPLWAEIAQQSHESFHQHAAAAFRQAGYEIYNATIGGNLEAYPRVELRSLFS